MDIPVNVNVHCADGLCGRSTYVLIDPVLEQVTHLKLSKQQIEALPAVPVRRWAA
jgi:hypothetical protein